MRARDRLNAKFDIDDDDTRLIYFFLSKRGTENEPIIGYWMMRPVFSTTIYTGENQKYIVDFNINFFRSEPRLLS
jgi:hypothetical protein